MLAAADRERYNEPVFKKRPNIAKLVSEIFGISERKVYQVRKNEQLGSKSNDKDDKFESDSNEEAPEETRGRSRIKLDDFNKNALSRLIHSFYTRPTPEIPTVDKIHAEALTIPGSL